MGKDVPVATSLFLVAVNAAECQQTDMEIPMLRTLADGLFWGFSMALGWILAFSLVGLAIA